MEKRLSYAALEKLGRVRLSPNFFFREFLYSEIANYHGIPNLPHHPDLAIEAARGLCMHLLEPLTAAFGKISIRSAYRAPEVNAYGNKHGLNCASNAANHGRHIFDYRDADGALGAMATIVINRWADEIEAGADWRGMAWFIHDHLPYSRMWFYPQLGAFNLGWSEKPERRIDSYVAPKGCLTKPGMDNHDGDHSAAYGAAFFDGAAERVGAVLE
jgi:hypothetical protein